MTPEHQQIAIAEACGWKFHPLTDHLYTEEEKSAAIMCWVRPGNDDWHIERVPDYLNDLNAMHEAEKVLTQQQHLAFRKQLWDLVITLGPEDTWDRQFISATAAQRAEAFLKTLNLWKQ